MSNSYVDAVEQVMNTKKSQFKFEIKQKVHHCGCNLNGKVSRRMAVDDGESTYILYDIIVAGKDVQILEGVSELWLLEGHLRED